MLLFSVSSHSSSETIKVNASMILIRCDNNSCLLPFPYGNPIQITLNTHTPGKISGSHIFKKTQDGYNFEAEIYVEKVPEENKPRYFFILSVSSMYGTDVNTYNKTHLGITSVTDTKDLNHTSWSTKAVRTGDISLRPEIILSAPDIN